MEKTEARKLGLCHTGISSRHREKVSGKVKSIRRLGYQCEIVTEKPDGLSRGPYANCNWYIAYADKNYERDNHKTYGLGQTWIRMENDFIIEKRYIGENLYYLIVRDDSYVGSEFAKNLNTTGKLLCNQLKSQYNATINEKKIALFDTLEDAKNALEWIQSVLLMSKINF